MRFTGATNNAGVVTPIVADFGIGQAIHVTKLGVNYRFGGVARDPSYAPVPPAQGTNWTGAYVGAQGGYGWGRQTTPDPTFAFAADVPRHDVSGWLAGGTVGVNAQAGRFVFGVEGEILATDIKGNFASTLAVPGGPVVTTTLSNKINWLGLATARAGFTVGDKLLVYGKGGVAIAEQSYNVAATLNAPPTSVALSGKAVSTGVVIGAGGEYAIAPNWSVKAEYNYVKMFAQGVEYTGVATGGAFAGGTLAGFSRVEQDLHLAKFGVNYHFNPQPVVVARY
ncbi:MAG: outer membrane beta-barrel protein [bacterium]|nr:outer membrane beta-barrel protein [bacterium]